MNKTARHGCLRSEVYQEIRNGILNGHYKRGESLREISLSKELGVSRTPVREAFCQLQLDGLVSVTPNKSVVVRGFDQQDIADLYEVRHKIEALAAQKAALQMTATQRKQLQEVFLAEKMATDEQAFKKLQELDSRFHNLIVSGSGSNVLQHLLSSLNIYTSQARLTSLSNPGRSQQALTEHERIMTAILERNSDDAYEKMQMHIANAAANYMVVSQNRR